MIICIGLDAFDSREGGCTTHLAFKAALELISRGYSIPDYPRLVRLNPDVPWKTRGNGAVCIPVEAPASSLREVASLIRRIADSYYSEFGGGDPAVLICPLRSARALHPLYRRALSSLVPLSEVYDAIPPEAEYWSYGNGRGLVGAAAAVGADLWSEDHTFELLAYRPADERSRERGVDASRLLWAEPPGTFANVDYETGRLLITPRGPDPVILGIRGESPEAVYTAFRAVKTPPSAEGWMIFVTNQGTFANLAEGRVSELQPYTQAVVRGRVASRPRRLPGGHVLLEIEGDGGTVDVMVYEPSGRLREVAEALEEGDLVAVGGGVVVKGGRLTVNAQVVWVEELARSSMAPPVCPSCGSGMVSLGRGKGYVCPSCKYHVECGPCEVSRRRRLLPGVAEPPLRSVRHLTRPIGRLGVVNRRRPPLAPYWIGVLREGRAKPLGGLKS